MAGQSTANRDSCKGEFAADKQRIDFHRCQGQLGAIDTAAAIDFSVRVRSDL